MKFSSDDIVIANRTYRKSVGKHSPIVPRLVRELFAPDYGTFLDFGAGTHAVQALELREEGYDVTAYDFGSNIGAEIDESALDRQYDVVYASNVLNVQATEEMLRITLGQIRSVMKGVAVMNYPSSPRKAELSSFEMVEILEEMFGSVELLPQSGKGEKSPLVVRVCNS